MSTKVNSLFDKVKNGTGSERENAFIDLSVILEMHAWNLSMDDRRIRFNTLAEQDILELKLKDEELKEIIDFFNNEINNNSDLSTSMIFAIGNSSADIGLKPLLKIIKRHIHEFDQVEFYGSLISIEKLIFFNETLSLEKIREILKEEDLPEKISNKILSYQSISHVDLKDTCLRVLARLVLLLKPVSNKE